MIPYFQFTSFSVGPAQVHVWGLMVALGILVGLGLSMREAKRRGLKASIMVDVTFWSVLAAMIGSRIVFVLGRWSYYAENIGDIWKIWEGGLGISGGFIGAFLAAWIVMLVRRVRFWDYADIGFFALPAGLAIGRLGCFFIFDHPGAETTLFFGQEYIDGVIRHNHGLYLAILGLLIFCLFLLLRRANPNRFTGFYMGWWMILYGIARFTLDFWRATDIAGADPRFFGLTIAQYVMIGFVIIGVLTLWKRSQSRKSPASPLHFAKHFQ